MKRTFESVLSRALDILAIHNEHAEYFARVPETRFRQRLRELGCFTLADLKTITATLLQTDFGLKPIPAKRIARVFHGRPRPDSILAAPPRYNAEEAARLTLRKLLAAYVPQQPNPVISQELGLRLANAGSTRCIVLKKNSTLDVSASFAIARGLLAGDEERKFVVLKKIPRPVYLVGEQLEWLAHEHPLFPEACLRSDGTDRLGLEWSKVSRRSRQFLRLVLESGGLGALKSESLRKLHRLSRGPRGLLRLRSRFPETSLEFDRRERIRDLPSLFQLLSPARLKQRRATGVGDVSGHLLGRRL